MHTTLPLFVLLLMLSLCARRVGGFSSSAGFSSFARIDSLQNPQVKHLAKLQSSSRHVKKSGVTILEGIKNMRDVLSSPRTRRFVQTIYLREDCVDALGGLLEGIETVLVTPEINKKISGVKTPQGAMCVCSVPDPLPALSQDCFVLILDSVSDPGNVGTLLRSLVAFTGGGIVVPFGDTANIYSPAVVRASAGACFRLDGVVEGVGRSFREIVDSVSGSVVVASMLTDHNDGETTESSSMSFSALSAAALKPRGLILGNEGNGISDEVKALVRDKVIVQTHVPMAQESVESLNVGVVGSIIMREIISSSSSS